MVTAFYEHIEDALRVGTGAPFLRDFLEERSRRTFKNVSETFKAESVHESIKIMLSGFKMFRKRGKIEVWMGTQNGADLAQVGAKMTPSLTNIDNSKLIQNISFLWKILYVIVFYQILI